MVVSVSGVDIVCNEVQPANALAPIVSGPVVVVVIVVVVVVAKYNSI